LFSLEQLLHGHGLVEVVFGLIDLFTSDQEPHIGMHQVLRSSATSGVKLRQGELRSWQALLGSFFTDGQRSFIVAGPIGGICKQICDPAIVRDWPGSES
jgi:hypothetical protein